MSVIIRVIGLEGDAVDGKGRVNDVWLKHYDLEAFDGRGVAHFTDDPAKALRFADMSAAFEAWKAPSKTRPVRIDGKPNRPLAAFSITFDVVVDLGE